MGEVDWNPDLSNFSGTESLSVEAADSKDARVRVGSRYLQRGTVEERLPPIVLSHWRRRSPAQGLISKAYKTEKAHISIGVKPAADSLKGQDGKTRTAILISDLSQTT
jgi:hypothetical protein